MLELVVAHYKEDLNWTNGIRKDAKITIYEKFFEDTNNIKLPNVGREGHTYLYHIINNYDNLNEYTCFLQGDPLFHDPGILSRINSFISGDSLFFGPLAHESKYATIAAVHPHGLPMYYFFDLLFGIRKNELNNIIPCYYGAQFIAHRSIIRNRPKKFYEFLIKFLSYETDPIEGYIIERLWLYIMNTKLAISDKYLLFMEDHND